MGRSSDPAPIAKPTLLVLASTYPRWSNDHEPGFVHELCRRLVDRFDVVAVVPDAPGADPSGPLEGVEVVRYRYAPRRLQTLVNDGGIAANLRRSIWKWLLVPGFVVMQYVTARRVMARRTVSVIHAHWLISPGVVARLLGGRRLPYVVTSHGGDLFGFRHAWFVRVKRWVASGASAMSVVSRAMRDEVERIAPAAPSVSVIPMGVDYDDRFRADESIERSTTELLFVGRLVAKKGLRHLLDDMPGIVALHPDVILRIVGFGPERGALMAQVEALGLERHVVFAGAMEQRDLPELYRRAAVFVAPFVRDASGDQEGLPVALMEAVATSCPFVVGDVVGLDDLLGDESGTFRVDPTRPGVIAAAVCRVLADPADARKVAEQASRIAQARVDWSVVASRYGDLLESTLTGKRP